MTLANPFQTLPNSPALPGARIFAFQPYPTGATTIPQLKRSLKKNGVLQIISDALSADVTSEENIEWTSARAIVQGDALALFIFNYLGTFPYHWTQANMDALFAGNALFNNNIPIAELKRRLRAQGVLQQVTDSISADVTTDANIEWTSGEYIYQGDQLYISIYGLLSEVPYNWSRDDMDRLFAHYIPPLTPIGATIEQLKYRLKAQGVLQPISDAVLADVTSDANIEWTSGDIVSIGDPLATRITSILSAPPYNMTASAIGGLFPPSPQSTVPGVTTAQLKLALRTRDVLQVVHDAVSADVTSDANIEWTSGRAVSQGDALMTFIYNLLSPSPYNWTQLTASTLVQFAASMQP